MPHSCSPTALGDSIFPASYYVFQQTLLSLALSPDFCKCLLGYFIIPIKSLLNSPLFWCLQGSCWQLAWWCVMTTANMVPRFPCAPLSASICSLSSCTQDMLMRLSLLLGEWQENCSNFTLATEDTSKGELRMSGPRLVSGCSTALALALGSKRSSSAVLPKCVCRDPALWSGFSTELCPSPENSHPASKV